MMLELTRKKSINKNKVFATLILDLSKDFTCLNLLLAKLHMCSPELSSFNTSALVSRGQNEF